MEQFRACMDLGNQGVINAGEMLDTYIHTLAVVTINVGLAQAHPNYELVTIHTSCAEIR